MQGAFDEALRGLPRDEPQAAGEGCARGAAGLVGSP
jgi:hypothetical protein